jgi:hypothetical protein
MQMGALFIGNVRTSPPFALAMPPQPPLNDDVSIWQPVRRRSRQHGCQELDHIIALPIESHPPGLDPWSPLVAYMGNRGEVIGTSSSHGSVAKASIADEGSRPAWCPALPPENPSSLFEPGGNHLLPSLNQATSVEARHNSR